MTINMWLHPALVLILGAFTLPFWQKGPLRKLMLVVFPVIAFLLTTQMHEGVYGVLSFMDWNLTFGRVDALSKVFAYIMTLMCIIGTVYGLHVDEVEQHIAAWLYVAGSLGVIFAGDYITVFLFWELMAFASVFLIWFRRGPQSMAVGYRYLLVHTFGGLVLLAGFILRYKATGDLTFSLLDVENPQIYTYLIMVGFMLNAAVPPLHAWLPDAYSEATVTGAVFMCAFTTKTAIYALIRSCAGMEILIPLGVFMAIYGIVYALMENDTRRLLAYEIISQLGYMVAAVGLGTDMAINGAVAHAFAHILYKGLLFMGCGSVLYMTGKTKFTELGGLYKKMPRAFLFTIIGGISISAFPFFSGFVTKSMIITAGFEEHLYWMGFILTLASAGTFILTGIKLPYCIFFGKNNCSKETWEKAGDPPMNMQIAMGLAAFLCLLIGSYTPYLYNMLPHQAEAEHFAATVYSAMHISETMQILMFTGLISFLFIKYLVPQKATISLDVDWFYRKGGRMFYWLAKKPIQSVDDKVNESSNYLGLVPLMTVANFWSWFDWHAIDGIVDGIARLVRGIGGKARSMQSGQLQYNLFFAVTIVAVVLISYVLM